MSPETPAYIRILLNLATQIPVLLVLFIGAVIALCLIKRHVGVSLLTIAGLGIIALTYLGSSTVHQIGAQAIIRSAEADPGLTRLSIGKRLDIFHKVVSVIASLLVGSGFILLLSATFCWRRPKPAVEATPWAAGGDSPFSPKGGEEKRLS